MYRKARNFQKGFEKSRGNGILFFHFKGENMDFHERLKSFLNENDHFAHENGMTMLEVKEGYAVAELVSGDHHRNGYGMLMGGALYTLSDFAFAAASNSFGMKAVGMTTTSSFVRAGFGPACERVRAVAKLVNKTRRTAVFDVDVLNSEGAILVHSVMTAYILAEPIFPEE